MYNETIGDVTQLRYNYYETPENGKSVVIPHVCNNLGAYNAGVAKQIRQKWPKAEQHYQRRWRHYKMCPEELLGQTQLVQVERSSKSPFVRTIVANMFGQHLLRSKKNPTPIKYDSLRKAMIITLELLNELDQVFEFHCPKFGCGLAGGYWPEIESMIRELWSSNHNVLVYSLGG